MLLHLHFSFAAAAVTATTTATAKQLVFCMGATVCVCMCVCVCSMCMCTGKYVYILWPCVLRPIPRHQLIGPRGQVNFSHLSLTRFCCCRFSAARFVFVFLFFFFSRQPSTHRLLIFHLTRSCFLPPESTDYLIVPYAN